MPIRVPGIDSFFNGQNLWLIGFIFLITSSLLGAVNFITTIIQLRAKGLTWMRLPFFVWAQFVTAFLLLLAFPPLEAAIIMQLMDRVAATSFFLPGGLIVNGAAVHISGGGSPLLWQHMFWFLGHPEVYVLILPGMGIVAEISRTIRVSRSGVISRLSSPCSSSAFSPLSFGLTTCGSPVWAAP